MPSSVGVRQASRDGASEPGVVGDRSNPADFHFRIAYSPAPDPDPGLAARLLMTMDNETIKQNLATLRIEHRDLDEVITRLSDDPDADQLQIQRLKKRKLAVKDLIARLDSLLLPDIIA